MTSNKHGKIEAALAASVLLFFIYAVLVWRGLIGDGSAWRPGLTVLSAGGLLAMTASPLFASRYRPISYFLMAVAVGLFIIVAARL